MSTYRQKQYPFVKSTNSSKLLNLEKITSFQDANFPFFNDNTSSLKQRHVFTLMKTRIRADEDVSSHQ